MAIAWFICPYRRVVGADHPTRYCAMDNYTAQIVADGGVWAETEVLGGVALVKVRASDETLDTIAADVSITRIPAVWRLTDTLSSLTAGQKNAILNKVQALGYSLVEIQTRFPDDIGTYTLGDVLRFVASRRLRPHYDVDTDTIICDGSSQPVTPIEKIDEKVK